MAAARQLKPKPVTVTDKNFDSMEELWEAMFDCPRCKDWVQNHDRYCCNCGVKLNWNLKGEYS